MGWQRLWQYLKHRMVRLPDSPYSIAAGVAIGCAVSWSPAFGTHLIQCVFFCWLIRANWIAGIIGTAFGNVWTTPLLLWISYKVGQGVLGFFGYTEFAHNFPEPQTLGDMMDHPLKVLIPMMVGGYICAIVTLPAYYFPVYYMIKGLRAARKLRIEHKAHKGAREVTGQDS